MLHAILWELPEPPSALNNEVPPALDLLVLEALQKDPRLRPTTEDIATRLFALQRAGPHGGAGSVTRIAPPSIGPSARSTEAKGSLPVVGRETEIEMLFAELDQVREGTGRVVAGAGAG